MKLIKKYGILLIAVGVLIGIIYLSRFSSVARSQRGKELYTQHCSNCHGTAGEGLRKLIPPLAGSDYVNQHLEDLPCIIRYGIKGEIIVNGQTFDQPMNGIPMLETDDIKNIMDYMIQEWYPEQKKMSHKEISGKIEACE